MAFILIMAKFTLHNEHGDFMSDTAKTFESAKSKCDKTSYKCKVFETYMAKSPWKPWDDKLVEHGKEVYRNF
jgi:hypothetical protein